jgi:serine/threonine protein kinase
MYISPNSTIAQYTIVSKIGEGGMGEVWRARDTRLGRDVAIKFLPANFAADADRLNRFEQEARATSALNHPNILTVFDIGNHDGSSFIVAELLEGEELRDRLNHGQIPLRKAIDYAEQIVNGLAAAHGKGIVHRDLKPENLFITNDDRVKILDFGLAKLSVPPAAAGGSHSEDETQKVLTNPGVVMGTVGYMSPEQVRGERADHRSDIFSFGAILHEMLTGRRAFKRETMAETMTAILKEEPVDLSASLPGINPSLERIVQRCLEKKPERRFQSTQDLDFALESLSARSGSSGNNMTTTLGGVERKDEKSGGKNRSFWIAAVLLIAGILLLATGAAYWMSRRPTAAPGNAGPPVVLLMDSPHPERVYDAETKRTGGTNADDLTDLLRDLPIVLLKENTNATWRRELQVLQEKPALIVAHRSCFYDTTLFDPAKYGDVGHTEQFAELAHDKFDLFIGYVGQANPNTRFIVYSRGSWKDEAARAQWVRTIEERFPVLRGRVVAMKVPLDRATFRNPITGGEIRQLIEGQLKMIAPR